MWILGLIILVLLIGFKGIIKVLFTTLISVGICLLIGMICPPLGGLVFLGLLYYTFKSSIE